MSSFVQSADIYVAEALKSWNIYTTLLAVALTVLITYPVFFPSEPDTHPLLLARQSIAAPVRRKGESALYRTSEVPHGYPLRTGLNVKDAAAPRWAGGKDGDLRDVWREVARAGGVGPDGREVPRGLIMRILGKDVEEHEIEDLSKEINAIGTHIKASGVKTLAIYLPNDLEYLLAIFACSFYGVSPVLLPYNLPHNEVYDLIKKTSADGLVCAAGSLPLTDIAKHCTTLRLLIWVVEKASRHMGWDDSSNSKPSQIQVGAWHTLVAAENKPSKDLPTNSDSGTPPEVITIWQKSPSSNGAEIVSFSHANLVAGIAGVLTSLPLRQRFNSTDLVVPMDSFSNTYTLCCTLAALFSHASIALNSVAGRGVDLAAATSAVKPTVVIVSAESLAGFHAKETANIKSGLHKLGMATQGQTLAAGRMPTDTLLFRLLAPSTSRSSPGKLRLLLTSERIAGGSPPLTSKTLSDLRIFTRARIAYALTSAHVAGAIAQSNVFDYRLDSGAGCASFGSPVGSVEVKVASSTENDVAGSTQGVTGELIVSGSAVVGGTSYTSARTTIRADGTIVYA